MAKKVTPAKKKSSASNSMALKRKPAKKSSAGKKSSVKVARKKQKVKPSPAKKRAAPSFSLAKAKAFVKAVKIPNVATKRGVASQPDRASVAEPVVPYTEGANQTLVVGSDIVSLSSALNEEQRKLVVNSLLLAQLAATKKVTDESKIRAWYNAYFAALKQIGWLVQDKGFTEYQSNGSHMEVNKAIIKIAGVVFGPAVSALAVVTATLNGLSEMSENAPWITLFKRTSERSKVSRFQITTAEATEKGTMVYTMAFELTTKNNLTQLLFFKLTTAQVTLNHASGKATLDSTMTATLGPAIEKKVAAHLHKNIEEIEI